MNSNQVGPTMQTPLNYVDLFDRLYPEQHLTGLGDENQINVDELNHRYATIRANQRTTMLALNGIFDALPDGSHFRDFMLPYWEVLVSRRFSIGSVSDLAAARYRSGFDPGGDYLEFPEIRTGFHMHDLGEDVVGPVSEVIVFSGGLVVAPSDYTIHRAQGGFSIYVKETKVKPVVEVVVLRKFNERGLTYQSYPVYLGVPGPGNTTDVVADLTKLGYVYDFRYYKLFSRTMGDEFFRPVPGNMWQSRVSDNKETALFTLLRKAEEGEQFLVLNSAEFWKFEHDGEVTEDSSVWKIDLVHANGQPAPVWHIEDVDVWVDGRLQRPGLDYWIEWGGVASARQAPRIIFRKIATGYHHVLAITNAPHDPLLNVTLRQSTITDEYGIFDMPPSEREFKLVQDIGLAFTGGYLNTAGTGIDVVGENLALHLTTLDDTRDLYFRVRFVLPPLAREMASRISQSESALEKLMKLLGISADGTFWTSDGPEYRNAQLRLNIRQTYRERPDVLKVPTSPRPEWNTSTFDAGYFWVRDEANGARSDDTVTTVIDCRPGADTASFLPWTQDGSMVFDCRTIDDPGYVTPRVLDCRGDAV